MLKVKGADFEDALMIDYVERFFKEEFPNIHQAVFQGACTVVLSDPEYWKNQPDNVHGSTLLGEYVNSHKPVTMIHLRASEPDVFAHEVLHAATWLAQIKQIVCNPDNTTNWGSIAFGITENDVEWLSAVLGDSYAWDCWDEDLQEEALAEYIRLRFLVWSGKMHACKLQATEMFGVWAQAVEDAC